MKLSANKLQTIALHVGAILGVLLVMPCWLLIFQLPPFREAPVEILIACPAIFAVLQLICFRQCLSADRTSIKLKWW